MKLYIEIDLEHPSIASIADEIPIKYISLASHLDRLRDRLLANRYEKKRGAIENINDVVTCYMEEN